MISIIVSDASFSPGPDNDLPFVDVQCEVSGDGDRELKKVESEGR